MPTPPPDRADVASPSDVAKLMREAAKIIDSPGSYRSEERFSVSDSLETTAAQMEQEVPVSVVVEALRIRTNGGDESSIESFAYSQPGVFNPRDVTEFLNNFSDPRDEICDALGFTRHVTYRRKDAA